MNMSKAKTRLKAKISQLNKFIDQVEYDLVEYEEPDFSYAIGTHQWLIDEIERDFHLHKQRLLNKRDLLLEEFHQVTHEIRHLKPTK